MEIKFTRVSLFNKKKILLIIMRLFIFLCCTLTFALNSETSFSQNVKIKIETDKFISVEEVFELIRRQTDYTFVYQSDVFKNAPKVHLKKGIISAHDLLLKSLSFNNMTYEITPKRTIRLKSESLQEQIRGTVLDENEQGLPGVNIAVKGTNKGAITDFNGTFLIDAGLDDILVFTYVGYKTKEVTITELLLKHFYITLEPGVNQLEEVVVVSTGYQKISKERSAGSFSTANINTVQNRPVNGNLLQTLDGQIPGLVINSAPNATLNPILIRGLTTIGTTDRVNGIYDGSGTNRSPLFVLDGIPIDDISLIDAQDVESVNVLKDATAASIWGSRAANGVIVITTKKGKYRDKIKVAYDGYYNFIGKPDLDYIPLLNSQQFIEGARLGFDPVSVPWEQAIAFSGTSRGLPPHEIIFYDQHRGLITEAEATTRLNELAAINNSKHIRDLIYRNALIENHALSLSGGGKKYTFYGSFSYNNFVSNSPGEKDDTFRINLRQDINLNKNIQVYLITNLSNNNTETKRNPELTNRYISANNRFTPYQLLRDANGNNLSVSYLRGISDPTRIDFENRSRINLEYNPLDEFNRGYTENKLFNSRITAGINIKLFDGLRFEGTYNYTNSNSKEKNFDSEDSYLVRRRVAEFTVADTPADDPFYHLPESGGRYRVDNRIGKDWTVRNQFIFDKGWNDNKHQLTVLLGQEASERVFEANRDIVWGWNEDLLLNRDVDIPALTEGIENTVIPNVGTISRLGRSDIGFIQTENTTRITSYYTNAAYTLGGKYTLNGSWRIDESNLFGVDKSAQNRPVWSFGVNWQLHKENFMQNIPWLDRLSLRVTSGITGNAPSPGTAASEDIIRFYTTSWVHNNQAAFISSVGNRKLTWERTKNFNIGLDFSIFNKIRGSFDVYNKKTSDLLGLLDTNNFTGYSGVLGNVGRMSNKGIELSLTSTNINNNNFSWESSLVLAHNKNLITKLNTPTPIVSGDRLIFEQYIEGHPAYSVFAYRFAGLDAMGDPQIELADGTVTKEFNKATLEDIINVGSSQPLWSGGFSNTFKYKNVSLMANAIFNLGHVMRKPNYWKFTGPWDENVSTDFLNRWQNPGDENSTNIPSYVPIVNESISRRNVGYFSRGDINVVSASYIKLRDITLSYGLPDNIIRKIKMDALKLRLTANNIMLWTANKDDIDPEFQGEIPFMQNTWTFGIRASF